MDDETRPAKFGIVAQGHDDLRAIERDGLPDDLLHDLEVLQARFADRLGKMEPTAEDESDPFLPIVIEMEGGI